MTTLNHDNAGGCGPDCACRPTPLSLQTPTAATIYLDHAATTPVRPEVVESMLPMLTETFGNPSSVHRVGRRAHEALENARASVAHALGASPREIHFTSGGTESNNLAVKGVPRAHCRKGKHLLCSPIEHHAVLNVMGALEKEGFEVTCLPVDRHGVVDLDALEKAIRPDTTLLSLMLANNETGTLLPIAEAAAIARRHGVLVHTDAVQAVGKAPVDVDALGVDLLSVSGHKFHGPKGAGVLYVRSGTRLQPILHGGHHERGKRPGTENVAAAVGLAKAITLAAEELPQTAARMAALRDRLEQGIRRRIDEVHIHGHPRERLPHILNVSFARIDGESMVLMLDSRGIAVSSGAACSNASLEASHVLRAMGVEHAVAQGSVRFSLGRGTTETEIDRVVDVLAEIVTELRAMSTLGP